ncbi:MAG TPA: inositol monophosphatase family protein [bacterium]|nr:inositol monophosphatase family protein [bacterium]
MTKFLKTAVRAAKAAGALQKKHYGKVKKIQFKGEINLVTEVDKACEKEILRVLRKNHPDHDILTEETGAHLKGSDYKWIVDPLDGTTNYAHGYPCFCVSIALEHRGKILVGVVYHPLLDELFWSVRGRGAYLNKKKIRVSPIKKLKRSLLATGFAYNVHTTKNDNIGHFTNFIKTAQAVRRDGAAAIDMCYIACGRFEGFWELGLKPWDTAAASLILEEAGGRSTLFKGQKLDLYADEIVASNGFIHGQMIAILRKGK